MGVRGDPRWQPMVGSPRGSYHGLPKLECFSGQLNGISHWIGYSGLLWRHQLGAYATWAALWFACCGQLGRHQLGAYATWAALWICL